MSITNNEHLILMRIVLRGAKETLLGENFRKAGPRNSFVTWKEIDGVDASHDICDTTASCVYGDCDGN